MTAGWWPAGLSAVVATLTFCVLVSWLIERSGFGKSQGNIYMVFLLGVVFVSARYGVAFGVLTALGSCSALAYFFMAPIWSLAVADLQQVAALVVLMTIGVALSALTEQIRNQARDARSYARRIDALYRLSSDLADLSGSENLVRAAVRHVTETFGGESAVFLATRHRGLRPVAGAALEGSMVDDEWEAVRTAFEKNRVTGLGTDCLTHLATLCVPLGSAARKVGVLLFRPRRRDGAPSGEQRQLLSTFAHQITGAMERDRLSTEVQAVQDEMENERLRSALLSSVSHDLRTPLAVIVGAGSSLLHDAPRLDDATRTGLYQTIYENAGRLARIVDNLLNMTQIESGCIRVNKQPQVLEEVVGTALRNMAETLQGRRVATHIPLDLPMVAIDDVLFQQVLCNLIDNAVKYGAPDRPIEISAWADQRHFTIEVADRGEGIPVGQEELVFEKFFRGSNANASQRGSGLGLTICRAIAAAHGGTISASNRPEGGAAFRIVLPVDLRPAPAIDRNLNSLVASK